MNKHTRYGVLFVLVACVGLIGESALHAAQTPLRYSQELGNLKLTVPADPAVRAYLGLKNPAGQFRIPDVRPGILIVEVFNMYCPHCQHYAPTVNELFRLIQTTPGIREKVRMLGIGGGNSPFEVGIFKKKYAVAFPLFDDKDYAALNLMPGLLTPYFMALTVDGRGGYRVFYSKDGGFSDPKAFLDEILKLARPSAGGGR